MRDNKNSIENDIKRSVEVLKKGGLVIFPTDTVYGLGVIPCKNSLQKIYSIKKRSPEKKIIALVSSKDKCIELLSDKILKNENELKKIYKIMEKFFPGDLTIICESNRKFTSQFDENMDTIGIRMPNNNTALKIIEGAGGIVFTTSANISGDISPVIFDDINCELIEKVDYVVKNNKSEENKFKEINDNIDKNISHISQNKKVKKPSTIVSLVGGDLKILREGNISIDDILKEI